MKIEHLFPVGRRVKVCDAPHEKFTAQMAADCGKEFTVTHHLNGRVGLSTSHQFTLFPSNSLTLLPHEFKPGDKISITEVPAKDGDGFVVAMRTFLKTTAEVESVSDDFIKLVGIPFLFDGRWISPLPHPSDAHPVGSWVKLKPLDDIEHDQYPELFEQAKECEGRSLYVYKNFIFMTTAGNETRCFPHSWCEQIAPPPTSGWAQLIGGPSRDHIGWAPAFDPLVGRCFAVTAANKGLYAVQLKGVSGYFHPSWLRMLDDLPPALPIGTPVEICNQPPRDAAWRPFMDVLCGQRSYVIAMEPPVFMRLAIAPEVLFTADWLTPIGSFDAVAATDSILRDLSARIQL